MATKTKPKRERRPKQPTFPGMEEPTHKDIDDRAEIYVDERDERIRQSAKEKEAKDALLEKMNEHGLEVYKLPDGQKVIVTGKKDVRVEKPKKHESNGEE